MKKIMFSLALTFGLLAVVTAQDTDSLWSPKTFQGLEFRSIGPAFMAGRIADIAIHPDNENIWYVAVGSGGVWKTENSGTTWTPIFDDQSVYSTGCVTIDPNNPNTIYVGTGENVGGRHVGFGNGIYRSRDGGKSWEHLGLKQSDHISKILIHPDNQNVIYAAVQGPLWSKGGQRGLYVSMDYGRTWTKTLGDSEWTGVTDIAMDPRDPNVIYAATWQRHRTVAAYMGGGPKTGIHRSVDGGKTWEQLEKGLPTSNMGKIGLAISPQNPDVIYAAIELDLRTGGVYRSTDRGQSWEKRSDAVAGATGPHYYQELYACPHHEGRLYLVDVRIQVSEDGGKTFKRMKEEHKHSDNHAVAFRKDDPNYLLVGTDGGIYETFDDHENWRFVANMPITQFYKLAVDDAEPFYNVYGGTQDNNTQGGPSRTDNVNGIQNGDWKVVLNWDGHQPATEPGNPDIMYGQRQEGTLSRIDLTTGEVIDIQPQPAEGEDYERYNWDAPILVSPHDPKQIYFASQRLWRSNNRGDEWTALSGDLTRDEERLELPIMGRKQSWNNPWDFLAMSNYNTITSIAESPVARDHIMIGTDDGIIQYTEDGGDNWQKIEVTRLPGVPARSYVNDIKADLFDANTWYAALDNHKAGDYKPYIYKTTNNGKSWTTLTNNLPDTNLVWRMVQDHVDPNLLFIGTEFGIYFSQNGGDKWIKMKGGLPTISFRDLTIQRRENDLVCASFGRSFYILDDISPLRNITEDILKKEAHLFEVKDALWYIPRPDLSFGGQKGSQGAGYYVANNPPFGAIFTVYVGADLKTKAEKRKEAEKELNKAGKDVPFPGWEALDDEALEEKPELWFVVRGMNGEVVRTLRADAKKGFQRVAWDLTYPKPSVVNADTKDENSSGLRVLPGTYFVELMVHDINGWRSTGPPQEFKVKRLYEGALEGASLDEVADFWMEYSEATKASSKLQSDMAHIERTIKALDAAAKRTPGYDQDLIDGIDQLKETHGNLHTKLYGSKVRTQPGEKTPPTLSERMFAIQRGVGNSNYGPTSTHKMVMNAISNMIKEGQEGVSAMKEKAKVLASQIESLGGPYIEGMD